MADTGEKAPVVRRRRTPRTPRDSKPSEAKRRPSTVNDAPTPERLEDIEQSVLRARKQALRLKLRGA